MVEIHLISPTGDGSAVERHLEALARAHATGVDLGARGPHIEASRQAIAALLTALQEEYDALLRSPAADIPEVRQALSAILSLSAALQPLIQAVRTSAA